METRRKYEQDLKEQVDAKKRVDEQVKRKEKEEEIKLERRLKEQQEKMKREFDEEINRKKAKEEAVSLDLLPFINYIFFIQKLKRQEELLKRQIELEKEVQQKKREADEIRLSEKRDWNKPRSRKQSEEREHQQPDYRTDSPPIPTMRGKENDEEKDKVTKKDEANVQEKMVTANRFDNNDGPESSQSNRTKDRSNKSRGNPQPESAAVVAQLQTMRQGLERKKKMLKEEDLGNEGWDALA